MNLGSPGLELRSCSGGLGDHLRAREAARRTAILACPDIFDGKTKEDDRPVAISCLWRTIPSPATVHAGNSQYT